MIVENRKYKEHSKLQKAWRDSGHAADEVLSQLGKNQNFVYLHFGKEIDILAASKSSEYAAGKAWDTYIFAKKDRENIPEGQYKPNLAAFAARAFLKHANPVADEKRIATLAGAFKETEIGAIARGVLIKLHKEARSNKPDNETLVHDILAACR